MKRTIIITGICALLISGYVFYKKQIELLKNYDSKIIGFRIEKSGVDQAVIDLKVRIFSKSTLEAQITSLNLDVYFENNKLATINDINPIIIPAKGYSDVDLKVSFSPAEVEVDLTQLLNAYLYKKDISIRINGYGKVKSAFLQASIPFSYSTTLKEIFAT